jgi:hypothetical protein
VFEETGRARDYAGVLGLLQAGGSGSGEFGGGIRNLGNCAGYGEEEFMWAGERLASSFDLMASMNTVIACLRHPLRVS